eukprot:7380555-Prymnesium_polylepis.2
MRCTGRRGSLGHAQPVARRAGDRPVGLDGPRDDRPHDRPPRAARVDEPAGSAQAGRRAVPVPLCAPHQDQVDGPDVAVQGEGGRDDARRGDHRAAARGQLHHLPAAHRHAHAQIHLLHDHGDADALLFVLLLVRPPAQHHAARAHHALRRPGAQKEPGADAHDARARLHPHLQLLRLLVRRAHLPRRPVDPRQ